jgi:hypothetical protein
MAGGMAFLVMKRITSFLLLLILLPLIVFGPACRFAFVSWDDDIHLHENPFLDLHHITTLWKAPYDRLYNPLTYTVWAGIAALARRSPDSPLSSMPFHVANLVLHILNTILVFGILRILSPGKVGDPGFAKGASWGALAGALVFSLHPVQVEPVAWVSGMRDLLCAFFGFLAIFDYLNQVRHQGCSGPRPIGLFILALLAKPAAVAIPVMAVVLDAAILNSPWRNAIKRLMPWFLIALAWTLLTGPLQPASDMAFITPWAMRPLLASNVLIFYLAAITAMMPLSPDYGLTPQCMLHGFLCACGAIGLIGLLYLIWMRRERVLWLASLCVFIAGLLPTLGLIPFNFQNISCVADRYLYLAMLGPALAAAFLVCKAEPGIVRARVVPLGISALLLFFACRSLLQLRYWRDSETLYRHMLHINPSSAIALNNLGNLFLDRGEILAAAPYYVQAMRLSPHTAAPRHNLALTLASQGRLTEAIGLLRQAVRMDPYFAKAQYHLGAILLAQGKTSEAISPLRRAVELDSGNHDAARLLARAMAGSAH